ncbi:hypothetical protein ACLKA6_010099 [Drosophila palustris]
MIVDETMRAALTDNITNKFKINNDDIHHYIGILMYMSIYRYPNLKSYWAKNAFGPIQTCMPKSRFEAIKKYFSLSDESERTCQISRTSDNVILPGQPDLGASANIVVRLTQTVQSFKNHIIYFDNFYTSLPLMVYLRAKGSRLKRKLAADLAIRNPGPLLLHAAAVSAKKSNDKDTSIDVELLEAPEFDCDQSNNDSPSDDNDDL